MTEPNSAQRIAEAVGARMSARDRAAQALGVSLEEVAPGRARTRMQVREDMLNAHDLCHGGVIFTLVDVAFGCACNAHNRIALAAGCSVDYLAPAQLGDVLTAVVEERAMSGRTGVYDGVVRNQDGLLIALFRGKSHRLRGAVLPELEETIASAPGAEQ